MKVLGSFTTCLNIKRTSMSAAKNRGPFDLGRQSPTPQADGDERQNLKCVENRAFISRKSTKSAPNHPTFLNSLGSIKRNCLLNDAAV